MRAAVKDREGDGESIVSIDLQLYSAIYLVAQVPGCTCTGTVLNVCG